MGEPRIVRRGSHVMLAEDGLAEAADTVWFDAAEWQRAGAVATETTGRGAVLIVEHGGDRWVLRHYRRGGLVSRFIEDHYLWLGLERTRAFREWRLLRQLWDEGLPVPKPVAAHVHQKGAIYSADILTSYLPTTQKLSWFIAQGHVPTETWRRVGRMVRAFHDHGVDHPDLTAHNVLLGDDGRVFLVDFDNARIRPAGSWRQAGVERLNRSLRKVALETGTEFDPSGWRELGLGYAEPGARV